MILTDFDSFGGKHCQTCALQKVLGYEGSDISEEMLLGLAGGVGFLYWYMKMMPAPIVATRSGGKDDVFLRNAIRRLGGTVDVPATASAKKGWNELRSVLDAGKPVIVYGDIAYLPFLAVPENVHFGEHTFVVYGIDEDADQVLISDRAKLPLTATIEDLARARASKHPPWPPRHRILDLSLPDNISPEPEAVRESISECCANMLEPPISNLGVKGIRKWAKTVPRWPDQFEGLALFGCLMNTYMFIETSGTGGSAFRTMYADFLDEAARICGEGSLSEVARMFRKSAKKWSAIADCAMPASHPLLGPARQLIARKNDIFEERGQNALGEMLDINARMDDICKRVETDLGRVDDIMSDMREQILDCAGLEQQAFQRLRDAVAARPHGSS